MSGTARRSMSSCSGGAPRRPTLGPASRSLALPLTLALTLALPLAACTRPRDIQQPIPDAVERTMTDSARYVLEAAARAITDEGMSVARLDEERGMVESEFTDITALKGLQHLDQYPAADRVVRFRFWTRTTFGGTRLFAEAVIRPPGAAARFAERMVPADHPAREALTRMLGRVNEHLRERRDRRERPGG